MKNKSRRNKSGQAFIEMAVSLIGIIVIVGAFIQLGILGVEQTDAIMTAHKEASESAMADDYQGSGAGLNYIRTWREGNDEERHTVDDRRDTLSPDLVSETILEVGQPQMLRNYLGDNPISDAYYGLDMMAEFYLVRDRHVQPPIRLLPVVRDMVYRADSITVEGEAVMTWTKGLY